MKRRRFLYAAILLTSCSAAWADIGTVSLQEGGVGSSLIMTIHEAGVTSNGYQVYVGLQKLNLASYGAMPIPTILTENGLVGDFQTFCIDIWDWSTGSRNPYDVVPLSNAPDPAAGPMDDTRARRLAELLDEHWPKAGAIDNIPAAALQAAIWEIVNEPDTLAPTAYSVNDGVFWLTGGATGGAEVQARDLADTWLQSLSADGSSYANYLGLTSPSQYTPAGGPQDQDYIVRVPISGAVLLGMLGLGAAGLKLRRFA